ncbi:MAG TPA: hypothetical protein VLJ15_03165 [Gammaproteobacteria bacterium]|nr:hypothetical protein [Gammaproteobacteria bacterium]
MINEKLSDSTPCIVKDLDGRAKREVREYLDVFYTGIYRARLLIEMSNKIRIKSATLTRQDIWAFFQKNLMLGAILVEVFSIFDRKGKSLIKEFNKQLHKNNMQKLSEKMVQEWIDQLKKYKDVRNKLLAHKDITFIPPIEVNYENLLDLLNGLEKQLLLIDDKYVADIPSSSRSRITSKLSINNPILDQFQDLLLLDEGCFQSSLN